MIAFWLIAAVMVVVAVLAVALPLLRARAVDAGAPLEHNVAIARERLAELEDERAAGRIGAGELAQLRSELEAALAADLAVAPQADAGARAASPWPALAVALLVPAVVGTLYLGLGAPSAIDGTPQRSATRGAEHPGAGEAGAPESIEEMVGRLQARLAQQPDDAGGWVTLGNTFMSMQRFAEAGEAYARAHELIGDDPRLLVRYADALAMAAGGRIAGKPFELAWRALAADPDNATALWLAGMGYREQGDYHQAIAHWQRLLPVLGDQPESQAEVRALIEDARAQLAQAGAAAPAADASAPAPTPPAQAAAAAPAADASATAPTPPAQAAAAAALSVTVRLDPALRERVAAGDTVFVYARAVDGPPMPLAVVRRAASELPLTVTLDDSQAMMPAMALSRFDTVRVGARVSRSGDATPRSGDLLGEVSPVKLADAPAVEIVIDEIVQ